MGYFWIFLKHNIFDYHLPVMWSVRMSWKHRHSLDAMIEAARTQEQR